MDLKLLERFLSAMMPPHPAAKQTVDIAFDCMKTHPMTAVPTIGMMIGQAQHRLYGDNEAEAANCARMLLTGVMIAWASEDAELRRVIIDEYLERGAKLRGENVVDFFDKKAGR
jgi:hypothetical protein